MNEHYEEIRANFGDWMEEALKKSEKYKGFRKKMKQFEKKTGFKKVGLSLGEVNQIRIQDDILSFDFLESLGAIKKGYPEHLEFIEETLKVFEESELYDQDIVHTKIEKQDGRVNILHLKRTSLRRDGDREKIQQVLQKMREEAKLEREKEDLTKLVLKLSFSNEMTFPDEVVMGKSLALRMRPWGRICRKWELILEDKLLKLEQEIEREVEYIDPYEAICEYRKENKK